MKYMKQFCIILIISFCGELLNKILPLPIPGSIYGILLMLIALKTKIIQLSQVRETAQFLIDIMPVLFIPAGVGLLTSWETVQEIIIPLIVITLITTILVMAVTGRVTQSVIRREEKRNERVNK